MASPASKSDESWDHLNSGRKTSTKHISKTQKKSIINDLLKDDEDLLADLTRELQGLSVKEDFIVSDWTDFIVRSQVTTVWFNVKTRKYYYYNKSNVKTSIGTSEIQKTQMKLYKDKRMAQKALNENVKA
jgi:hypothetical protein